jgi:hypothetical protein
MIVATEALSSPKVRIGHIGGNFTLPRTVPLASLVAGAVGAFAGILVALVAIPGVQSMMYCAVLGGIAGVLTVTYSPLKGESLSLWMGLKLRTRRQNIKLEGGVVQLAVGVALLKSATLGEVHIVPGAVNVPPSQYDDRGAPLDHDDILRSILEETGTIDMAETVLTGAVDLSEVENSQVSYSPLRRRARPTATETAPRPLTRPARPLHAPSSPDINELIRTTPPSPTSTPTTVAFEAAPVLVVPEPPLVSVPPVQVTDVATPDLPDPEGLSEWLAPPTPSLDELFATPVPTPDSVSSKSVNETFAHVEKKVAPSGWITAPDDSLDSPAGWTRPRQ